MSWTDIIRYRTSRVADRANSITASWESEHTDVETFESVQLVQLVGLLAEPNRWPSQMLTEPNVDWAKCKLSQMLTEPNVLSSSGIKSENYSGLFRVSVAWSGRSNRPWPSTGSHSFITQACPSTSQFLFQLFAHTIPKQWRIHQFVLGSNQTPQSKVEENGLKSNHEPFILVHGNFHVKFDAE